MSGTAATPWRAVVFAPAGGGATRRRGSDAFRIVGAVLVVVACWIFLLAGAGFEKSVVSFVSPPPFVISWLVTTALIAASFGAIVAAALVALLSRRFAIGRDLLGRPRNS
jgi:heme/copper-type cytochrome/quinol oxidase subunit 1